MDLCYTLGCRMASLLQKFKYFCVTESCQTELASAFSVRAVGCEKEN